MHQRIKIIPENLQQNRNKSVKTEVFFGSMFAKYKRKCAFTRGWHCSMHGNTSSQSAIRDAGQSAGS